MNWADVSRNIELRDVNPIGERIWLVERGARLPRCRSEQHSFRWKAVRYFGVSEATIFSKRGSPRSGSQ
ncbi:MAG: hypothetical protein DME75_12570, partial [Verrucomicrobia bacterium]